MANYENLIASIKGAIKSNNTQAITGQVLQDTLLDMVSKLGEGLSNKLGYVAISNNLFNPNDVILDAILSGNSIGNVQEIEPNTSLCVAKIAVDAGIYTFGGNGDVRTYSVTDANDVVLKTNAWVSQTTTQTVDIPDNGSYLWLSVYKDALSKAQVNKGSVKLPYDAYNVSPAYDGKDILADMRGEVKSKLTLSNSDVLNNALAGIYTKEFSASDVYLIEVKIAQVISGEIYNAIIVRDSSEKMISSFQSKHNTIEEAIADWGGLKHSSDGLTMILEAKSVDAPLKEVVYNAVFMRPFAASQELRGKVLSVNGDSICAGAGYAGGYGKIIAERNEMTLQNIGRGGGTITSGVVASDGTVRHSVCDTIENMRADADYAIIEGGVNDAGLTLPIGVIESGYNASFDTSTYCGAFEQMCKALTYRFAGKKYGYIAVHQMVEGYRVTNTDKANSYYWTAKAICEKWGVPFLDLNVSVPPFNYLDNTTISSVNDTYTMNGDGWHPNELGYKKYYCDKIEAWMKTL